MTFGIQVFGPSGAYTVLDTSIAMQGTVATTYGTATSVSYDEADILVVRKEVVSGSSFILCSTNTVSGTTITQTFTDEHGTPTDANYAILKVTNSITPSGSYGHVTFASDGTTRVFDSRLFDNIGSFNISSVAPQGAYFNGSTLNAYNTYEYYNGSWLGFSSISPIRQFFGLRFSNNDATHGTSVKFASFKTTQVTGGTTTFPQSPSGVFWGNFV